jgi:hypothetical protein
MKETKGKPHGTGRIYWIGGSKGGVGKSRMTVVTLDCLLARMEAMPNADVHVVRNGYFGGELRKIPAELAA